MSSSSGFPAEADAQRAPWPSFTPGRFTGRTAIVTGAGSGIGRAPRCAWPGEHRGLLQGQRDPRQRRRPGPVATDIQAPFRSEHAAGVLGPIMQTTIPPVATAEQLAATITWLLSDDASNVNGAVLPADGGWSAI